MASDTTPIATNILSPTYTEVGLSTNTLYGRVVTAIINSVESGLSNSATTYTLATKPTNSAVSAPTVNGFTFTWNVNANPAGTRFEVSRSTDNFVTSVSTPIQLSDNFTSNTTTFNTLSSGTTYYVRVRAANGDSIFTLFDTTVSTQTLPSTPTGLTGVAQGVSSMTWSWSSVTGATGYKLYQATSSVVVATITNGATLSFTDVNLTSNTAYGRRISAIDYSGESAISAGATFYTLAAIPGTPTFSNVLYTSFTVTWPANNPAGTKFEVSRSTDNFATTASTPIAFTDNFTGTTTDFVNLTPGTTYYVRIRAQNGDGFNTLFSATGSTVTLRTATPTGLVGVAQGVSSITWTWNAVTGADTYNLYIASDTTPIATGLLSPTFTETGLSTNTAYGRVVSAVVGGIEGTLSNSATTYTLASKPTNSAVSAPTVNGFTFTWNVNANPAGTRFEVSRSTDNFVTSVSTPIQLSDNFTSNTTTFDTLSAGTTYYVRVRAANGDSVFTLFDTTVSTQTLPSTPTGLTGVAQGVSSITWNWSAVTGATGYKLYQATSSVVVATISGGATLSYTDVNLTSNTAYGRRISAIDYSGESAISAGATFYTLAAVPGTPTFSNVASTSFTVTWLANNPAGTRFEVSRSTDNFATTASTPIAFSDNFTGTTTDFVNLIPATTYYVRIRAENGDSIVTLFSSIGSTVTLPAGAPTGLVGVAQGVSSITWTWNAVTGASSYNLYYASSPTLIQGGIASPTFTEVGLTSNTAYGRVVTAIVNTVESGLSNSATTYTLAAVPGTPTFSNVLYTSFTVTWPANNPAGTKFEVTRSTDNFATTASTPIAFADNFTGTTTNFVNLVPATTYYVRIRAQNGDGFNTLFSATGSTVTLRTATPTGLVGVAQGVSSITWTWNAAPGADTYNVYYASDTTSVATGLLSPSYIEVGLSTNTAYGRRVSAVTAGVESFLSASATTYTLASTPGTPTFSNVASTSFTVTWSANANPAGTRFEVSRSTDNFATTASTPIAFADNFTGTTTDFVNLIPATTYYVRIRAENGDSIVTLFSGIDSTVTLPAGAPTGLVGVAQGVSSITWTWNAATGASSYNLYVASDTTPIATGIVGTNYTEVGLSTNTLYGRVVTAIINSVESGLSNSATTYTLASKPTNSAVSAPTVNGFTFTWNVNANPAGTRFEVSRSTDNFVTSVSTPIQLSDNFTSNTTTFDTLSAGTTYYVRVRAANGDSIFTLFDTTVSTQTLPSTPTGLTGVAQGVSSMTWSWSSATGATGYKLYQATSTMVVATISGGATLSYTEVNLTSNTAYGRRISAIDYSGESAISAGATFYTLAAIPGTPTFSNVLFTSFTVTWPANNPAGTKFEVSRSTDNFATTASTPIAFTDNFTGTTTDFVNLTPGTTYYVRIRAQNGDGFNTLFSATGSTVTLRTATPTGLVGVAQGVSSITWTWNSVTSADTYNVYFASDTTPVATGLVSPSYIEVGLSTNTAYGRRVTAVVGGIESTLSASATTYTLASTPTNSAVSAPTVNGFTFTWNVNANPAGTRFEVSRSTDNFVTSVSTPIQLSDNFTSNTTTFDTLSAGTTYYVRVRAANGDSIFTLFDNTVSTQTLPSTPTSLTGVAQGVSSITWNWSAVTGATGYKLYQATSTMVVATISGGATLSYTEVNLTSNTAYGRRISAVDYSGESAISAGATFYTLAAVPGTPTFSNVASTSFTVTWLANNPAGTRFEVSRSTDNFATTSSTPIAFADNFTGTTTDFVNLIPATTYYVRIRAENGDSIVTLFSGIGSTVTLPAGAPTGLVGVAQGVSSITWTWNAATGASSYNLYVASDTTPIAAGIVGTNYTEVGLSTNTLYGRVVTAIVNSVESALSNSATTYTLAAAPNAPTFSNVLYTSFTVTWTSPNPAGTKFEVTRSTDNFATTASTPIAFSDNFTGTTTDFLNLIPGTTYYVRIRAQNGDGFNTLFSGIGSTVTLRTATPTGLVGVAQGVSSITWTWNAAPGADTYNVYFASDTTPVATGLVSPSYIEVGLSTNTAYGRRVTAVIGGVESGLSNSATTYTLASKPTNSAVSAPTVNGFTFTWNVNSNPAGTRFEVSRSTDNFVTSVSTPIQLSDNFTSNTTTFDTLSAGTTYYVRVRAANGDSIFTLFDTTVSTQTLPSTPTGLTGVAQGVSSMTWSWSSVTGATGYKLYQATSSVVVATITNGATLSFTDVNLTSNTAYGRRISAVDYSGESAISAGATFYTLAAVPGTPTFSNVASTSFTVTWLANNPAGTRFEVSRSTDNFATTASTPIAFADNFTGTTTDFVNLIPATTYYVRIRAENGDSIVTLFSGIDSTVTLPAGAPTGLVGVAQGVSSITWTWNAATGASSYNLYVASDTTPIATNILSPTYTEVGLSTNTLYGRVVTAIINSVESGLSNSATTYTLASKPTNSAVSAPTVNGFTFTWNVNANPAGTRFEVSRSTDNFVTSVSTPIQLSDNFTSNTTTFNTLSSGTTYYVRVRAANGDSIFTLFDTTVSTQTLPSTPTGLTGVAQGVSSMTWSWSSVTGATGYKLYQATSSVVVATISGGATLNYTEVNLTSNTAYGRRISAIDYSGESAISAGATFYTLAAIPGTPTFSNVLFTSFTVTWPANNPAGTKFEVSRSTDNFATTASTPIAFTDNFTGTTTDFVNLTPGTTYYVRIRAQNGDGFNTLFSGIGSTTTLATSQVTGLVGVAQGVSSITWTWNAISGADSYNLYIASDTTPIATGLLSPTFTETGLSTNTAYGRVVSAVVGGIEGTLSNSATTYTLASRPGQPSFTNVTYSSFTITWSANANPAGTRFEVTRSTDNFATSASTPIAFSDNFTGTTTNFVNLIPTTTYYVRIRAENGDNITTFFSVTNSTVTPPGPAPINPTIVGVFASSMNVTWGTLPQSGGYSVEGSTSSDFNPVASSAVTSTAALGTLYLPSLNVNTTYYVRVGALWSGTTSYSPTVPASTSTLTNLLSGAQVYRAYISSITANWLSLTGNGGAEGYRFDVSTTSNFQTIAASSITYDGNLSTLTVSGLSPDTTYYLRAGGLNWNKVPNYTLFGSTTTAVVPAPSGLAGTALGVSSITWGWGAVGGASSYNLYVASDATPIATGLVGNTFTEMGLSTNTIYGRVVTAIVSGVESGLSASATAYTMAAVPGTPVASNVTTSSFTITWSANSNPSYTHYEVSQSTDVSFATAVSTPVTFGQNLTATTTGLTSLTPGTTYYFRIRAENGDARFITAFSATGSTVTLAANYPTGLTGTALGVSSISWTWNSVLGADSYNLYAATGGVIATNLLTTTYNNIGLSTNTAYGRRVSVVITGIESALSPSVTTYTLASIPGQPSFSNVFVTSFTVTWNVNANPAGTRFEVSRSTDATFATAVSTPVAFAANFTGNTTNFAGLLPAATYYVRIRAENGDAIVTNFSTVGSTVTQMPTAPTNFQGVALGVSSITWSWDSMPGASSYNLYYASSTTLIQSGIAGTSFIETGLSTNTAYGRVVTAIVSSVETGLSNSATTYTLAARPGAPVPSTVGYSSFTITWPVNSNPAGTRFEISRSTDASFATAVSTPVAFSDNLTANTTDLLNLLAGTTYFVRVRAQNGDSIATSFSTSGSTVTLPVPVPTFVSGTAQGVSSITWTWSSVPGATYNLKIASNPATVLQTGLGSTSFTETGLSTNTAYGRVVTAVLNGIESALSNSVTTYTLASTPGTPTFSNVRTSSFTVTWSANGNPSGTIYEISQSTVASFASNVSTIPFSANFTGTTTNFVNLMPATTYYVRVRAENGDFFATTFSATGSTVTLPVQPPAGFQGTAQGVSSITWTWGAVTGATSYNLYYASSTTLIQGGIVGTSFTETGLSTNTAYGRAVTAVVSSVETALSNSATVYTLAAVPTGSAVSVLGTTNLTFLWSANGNPSATSYQAQLSTNAAFTGAVSSVTLNTNAAFTGLTSNATYYFRVRATNGDGFNSAFDTTVTTATLPVTPVSGSFTSVEASSITIAWGASTNASGSQYQAEVSTISLGGAPEATLVVTSLSATFQGLQPDTTYYARVKTLGVGGTDSAYLVIGTTLTLMTTPTNVTFSQVYYSSVTVTWVAAQGPTIVFTAELGAGGNPFATPDSSSTYNLSADFAGLSVNSLYFLRVRAQNTATNHYSAYSAMISTYTLANDPVLLSTTSVTTNSVGLTWSANGNPAGTNYRIQRSTDGTTFVTVSNSNSTSYTDIGLLSGTAYSFRIQAVNGSGAGSGYSNIVSIVTDGSVALPRKPSGLLVERLALTANTTQITLRWHPVTKRTDGSTIGLLSGYEVYVSSSLLTPRSQWSYQGLVGTESWSTVITNGSASYYCLRALDNTGQASDWSHIVDDTTDMTHFFLASDNITRVQVPQSATNALRYETNKWGADVEIEVAQMTSEETGRVVRSVEFMPYNQESGNLVTDLTFDPPVLRGVIAYSVVNGKVVQGSKAFGAPGTPVIDAAQASQQLSLFWNNGNDWVKTTGLVNSADNTVSFTGGRAGRFQIRVALRVPGITLTRVYPRIITPNGDGWNDKAIFQFDNPQLLPLSGKIFDIIGAHVADLAPGPQPDSTLAWDGKDSGGRVVPGGIYVYQLEANGQTTTGTVVVAR